MDSVCSLTLYRGVVVPPFKTAATTEVSPSPESPPPPHSSSTRLPPPPSPPPSPLSSDVVASFSPFRNLYQQQPVALLMYACLRERRSRVYKRPRVCVCVCVNTYTDSHIPRQCERGKKERRRKEETRSSKKRAVKEEEGKEEKNKRKSSRLDWWK